MEAAPSIAELEQRFKAGSIVKGIVSHHAPIGFFVHLGGNAGGLVRIIDVKEEGVVTAADYPPVGSEVDVYVWGVATGGRPHVILSIRPSLLRGAV
jgi:predicted RNA-binding protein with RPS1 domain